MNKQVAYGYDDGFLTHQPRVVYDTVASESYNLYWDANGNLQEVSNCKMDVARFHDWDVKRNSRTKKSPVDSSWSKCGARVCLGKHRTQHVRLQAAIGPQSAGIYGYDGDGNRVWKLTGLCWNDGINRDGPPIIQGPPYSVIFDDATLYPNPYITISLKGYTKHFYIEQERISTVLGEGGWSNAVVNKDSHDESVCNAFSLHWEDIPCEKYESPANEDIVGNTQKQLQYDCNPECIESIYLEDLKSDFFLNCISSYQQASGHKETIYFTHDDHLSSASWITDVHGDPVQYIHYAPYGELLASQHAYGSSYDERYKFTGKERDAESGYDYYGARYQIVPLGIWGSPDPMLDKTIHMSSYMYCNGNPIVLRDPDGNLGVAAMILVGAGVGAVINGGIALYNGKSMSEVGAAALGGAVSGAIGVVVGEVLIGVGLAATTAGMVGGAVGEGLGDAIEQGVNMIAGNQNSFDLEEMGVSIAAGAVFGKIGAHAQGKVKSVSQKIKTNVNQYYQNSKVIKSTKKEVRKECYLSGNTSKKVINKKTTERLENMKNVDNFIVDCAEETLDKVVIPATNNVLIEKTDDAVR